MCVYHGTVVTMVYSRCTSTCIELFTCQMRRWFGDIVPVFSNLNDVRLISRTAVSLLLNE